MLGYLLTFLRLNNEGTFSISVQSCTVRFSGKVTFSGRLQKYLNLSLSGYRKLLKLYKLLYKIRILCSFLLNSLEEKNSFWE